MIKRKVYNKRAKFEDDRFFIKLPSDTLHYIHHPRMSAEKLLLYALIVDYYNAKEGCAFPSIETLALRYGKTADTTSRHLDDLKSVQLIDFEVKGYYVPLMPLKEDDFYSEFPEAWDAYKKKAARSRARREAARDRVRKWRARKGYTD